MATRVTIAPVTLYSSSLRRGLAQPLHEYRSRWNPGASDFKTSFNHCKVGQHIRNRGSDHTGQHNCKCHGTSFAAVVGAERIRIAAVRVPLSPKLFRKLPAAQSSHHYGDRVYGNNSHDDFLLNTVVADGSALMVHSSIVKIRNDQRSWMSARVSW